MSAFHSLRTSGFDPLQTLALTQSLLCRHVARGTIAPRLRLGVAMPEVGGGDAGRFRFLQS